MRNAKSILLAVLGLSGVAFGQTPPLTTVETLIQENETVVGLGAMLVLQYVLVNDSKTWMVQLSTNFSDTNRDGCLFSNGFVVMREGSPLSAPAGNTLDDWNSLSLSNRGDLGLSIKAKPATGVIIDGAYWNSVKVAVRGDVVDVPPFDAHAVDTKWETIPVVKLNALNQLFLLGEVANPALSRSRERTLIRYQLDDAGNILDTTVLATEGMTLAGLTLRGTACLGNQDSMLAVNDRGDTITMVAQDSVQQIVINLDTVLARSLTASPVPGKDWREGGFALTRVAINARGEHAFTGSIGAAGSPDGYLIVKNGQKFVQQSDQLPVVGNVGPGTSAPLYIANTGDVFWHVRGGTGDAFMRNHEIIVQGGRTIVDNRLVTSVSGSENSFAIGSNGRFWVGNVSLQTVGQCAIFADFGLVLELPGCRDEPPKGTLKHTLGKALVGDEFQLAMDDGQAPGAAAALFFSKRAFQSPAGCGVNLEGYGELMLAPPISGSRNLPAWDGTNPVVTTMRIPDRIALLDAVFFVQGLFFSPGHPTEPFRLTNGMRVEIGAP